MQVGDRQPRQKRVGICDETRQRRDAESLSHRDDLRLGIRDPERNLSGANITLVGPVWFATSGPA